MSQYEQPAQDNIIRGFLAGEWYWFRNIKNGVTFKGTLIYCPELKEHAFMGYDRTGKSKLYLRLSAIDRDWRKVKKA